MSYFLGDSEALSDSEANIIHANGLAPFSNYRDRLYSEYNDNEVFDVLLANSPYSVKQFYKIKNTNQTFMR